MQFFNFFFILQEMLRFYKVLLVLVIPTITATKHSIISASINTDEVTDKINAMETRITTKLNIIKNGIGMDCKKFLSSVKVTLAMLSVLIFTMYRNIDLVHEILLTKVYDYILYHLHLQTFDVVNDETRDFQISFCNSDEWNLKMAQTQLRFLKKSLDYENNQLEEIIKYLQSSEEEDDEFSIVNYGFTRDVEERKDLKIVFENLIHHLNE